jgi:proteasome accessory factor A
MPQLRDSSSEERAAGESATVRGIGSTAPSEWASDAWKKDPHNTDFSRIFGIETEYGISVTRTRRHLDPSRAAMTMFEPVVSRQRSTNTYLTNGSRLYLDVGSHPEYATAEARTPRDAVAQDAAGEHIMRGLAKSARTRLAEELEEPALALHVYKNNVDAAGNSFGCHENYLLRRAVPLKRVEQALIPFLSTRLVWAGAGRVVEKDAAAGSSDGSAGSAGSEESVGSAGSAGSTGSSGSTERDFGYEIAQRAGVLDEAVSSATTRVRPMINTRDEPHANPDQFRRLHVIVGDSNRSQTSTWLRLATTHLVLCMIEQDVRDGDGDGDGEPGGSEPGNGGVGSGKPSSGRLFSLLESLPREVRENPLAVMKAASRGERAALATAVAAQRVYCDAAMSFTEVYHRKLVDSGSIESAELDEALRRWNEAVSAAEIVLAAADGELALDEADRFSENAAQPFDVVATLAAVMPGWVEWAAKLRLLQAFRARHAAAGFAQLEQIELAYHDIAGATVYEGMVARGGMPEIISTDEVARAAKQAPLGTRAQVRGDFVRHALDSHAEWSCDWTHIEVRNSAGGRHIEAQLLDPFGAHPSSAAKAVFSALADDAPAADAEF